MFGQIKTYSYYILLLEYHLPSILICSYEEKTTETTSWEHAWGFEFSYEQKFSSDFIFASSEITLTATMSYNGKYGTSSTTTDTQRVENIKTFPCPPRSKCEFRLIANHLDNQAIPFTALVRKTIGSDINEYEEKGIVTFKFKNI